MNYLWCAIAFSAALSICSAQETSPPRPLDKAAAWWPKKIASQHLPNAYELTPWVISGGQPEGDAAFRDLVQLGVKTLISVDAAAPDLELAKKYGLRYVHLPHGYAGIPQSRALELAKAVRDLPGPIYVHCHHGKHRSPTAAAVACVGAGLLPPGNAEAVLRAAGTSEEYPGLFDSARGARRVSDDDLDRVQTDFPERAPIPRLAEAMAGIDLNYHNLQQAAAAGWKAPAKNPDLDPRHEALQLAEHFAELLRQDDVRKKPAKFLELLAVADAGASDLEHSLRSGAAAEASATMKRVTESCAACHRAFRDRPLDKK